jgi:predicted PurR-regulated permease PerM
MTNNTLTFGDAMRLAIALGLVAVALIFLFAISDILLIFLTALIFAIALDRPIDKLVHKGIPRSVSAVLLYSAVLVTLIVLFYIFLPPLAWEIRNFAINYPLYLEEILGTEEAREIETVHYLRTFAESVGASSQAVMATIARIFGGLLSFAVIFFLSLFLNIQKEGVRGFLMLLPLSKREESLRLFDKIQIRLGGWFWGKLLSSLLVGAITLIGLLIIGIPYAVILSLLAVLFNFIPYAGPILSSIPAIAIGLSQSLLIGVAVAALYFLVNGILENFIFGPLLMKKVINLNPAMLVLAVVIGAQLGGILGIVIAIPAAAIVHLFLEEFYFRKWSETSSIIK